MEELRTHRALAPDEFLSQRGGDCEDFALYTFGMLEVWAWYCKMDSIVPPGIGSGHAITMVWSASPGNGYIHVGGGAVETDNLTEAAYTTAIMRLAAAASSQPTNLNTPGKTQCAYRVYRNL